MDTTWNNSASWYDKIVSHEGHYYHTHIILPRVLSLLGLKKGNSLLDLACGQGVFARAIPEGVSYLGIDGAPNLLKEAAKRSKHSYLHHDLSKPIDLKSTFSHAVIILALQNMEYPEQCLKTASDHLVSGGKLLLVLNHPHYRIPRQSQWGVDESKKLQYRRVDRYKSRLKIPIQMQPAAGKKSETTWSFHYSLEDISHMLKNAGFLISSIEEWTSDKQSSGKNAKMENRARDEFPLFMTLCVEKR